MEKNLIYLTLTVLALICIIPVIVLNEVVYKPSIDKHNSYINSTCIKKHLSVHGSRCCTVYNCDSCGECNTFRYPYCSFVKDLYNMSGICCGKSACCHSIRQQCCSYYKDGKCMNPYSCSICISKVNSQNCYYLCGVCYTLLLTYNLYGFSYNFTMQDSCKQDDVDCVATFEQKFNSNWTCYYNKDKINNFTNNDVKLYRPSVNYVSLAFVIILSICFITCILILTYHCYKNSKHEYVLTVQY